MGTLQKVIRYWYECIKSENALEKDISLSVRSRAVLYPFDSDSFVTNIWANSRAMLDKQETRIARFHQYVTTQSLDVFYGYPLLCYQSEQEHKTVLAPLLVRRVSLSETRDGFLVTPSDHLPTFGIQAMSKLGARTEEISDFNCHIPKALSTQARPLVLAQRLLAIPEADFDLQRAEPINPERLTNTRPLRSGDYGLFNKNMLFAGERTAHNMHLLADLEELCRCGDLESTALAFLTKPCPANPIAIDPPILPFPSNEFQIGALQRALSNNLTVVTGPPGTGKSQLIANLLVDILLRKESCLLVSHTNEAVNIVDTKLNGDFPNILTRTGSKEFRQELKGRFNELLAKASKPHGPEYRKTVKEVWLLLQRLRSQLLERDKLERVFAEQLGSYETLVERRKQTRTWWHRILLAFQIANARLRVNLRRNVLERLSTTSVLEQSIRDAEDRYFAACRAYVQSTYVNSIVGDATGVGAVNAYLGSITTKKYNDRLNATLFARAALSLRIWCSTLKSVRASFPLEPCLFDYVIFDEASQVDLPSAAPALYRARKAIIVGDSMQLNHIAGITQGIDRQLAITCGLIDEEELYPTRIRYTDVSLYSSAERSLVQRPILLANHYRSDDEIISLCNQIFYSGQLRVRTRLNTHRLPPGFKAGVQWIDVAGEVVRHPSGSRVNELEIRAVCNVLERVMLEVKETRLTIGVVTPYSRQQAALEAAITSRISPQAIKKHDVKILTAHKFQGSEKDIMIFSAVLAAQGNANSDRWYNINPQLLNVALSRARLCLYIVGDRSFCASRPGILGKVASTYRMLHAEKRVVEESLRANFDTVPERILFEALSDKDPGARGYTLVPKKVIGRYTLGLALLGVQNVDVECDGTQHEIIEGLPVIEDLERDLYIVEKGWRVVRVPNHRILFDSKAVASQIIEGLGH
jgi:very-short-patch-repair endonuclease